MTKDRCMVLSVGVNGPLFNFFFIFLFHVAWLCSSCFECVCSPSLELQIHCRKDFLIRVKWEWRSGIFQARIIFLIGCYMLHVSHKASQHKTLRWETSPLKTEQFFTFFLFVFCCCFCHCHPFPVSCWLLNVCWEGNLVIKHLRQTLSSAHLNTLPPLGPLASRGGIPSFPGCSSASCSFTLVLRASTLFP